MPEFWKKSLLVLSLCAALATYASPTISEAGPERTYLVDTVNPLIGTTGVHPTEYGGRIPAVMTPFGMTQWSAMTRENSIGTCPYHYKDTSIIGFIGTHQPSIWMGDYGYLSFMPQTGKLGLSKSERAMDYRHENEKAHPYHYEVILGEGEHCIRTEHTASERCVFFRFTYPEDQAAHLSLEMSRLKGYAGWIKILPEERKVIGYNADHQNEIYGRNMGPRLKEFKGWFVLEFDTDFEVCGTWKKDKDGSYVRQDGILECRGDKIGGYLTFRPGTKTVQLKIASSFISAEQAEDNLHHELRDWNFQTATARCKEAWEKRLRKIEIEGGTTDERTLFYTCLANTLMYPSLFSEYGRYYSPFDEKIHEGISYNAYSLWDTFRALHPLLILIAPDQVGPMITALLQMYEEGGWIPKWPNPTYSNIMIGTHSDAVIADACVKGIHNFNLEKAYEAVYKNAMTPPDDDRESQWADRQPWKAYEGRGGLSWYKDLGYVPSDKTKESVSRTLEFAYDDFCVAQVAQALGKDDDAAYFLERSKNYRHLYDPESGFMHARHSDGTFAPKIDENRAFTEGSPWTYLFCAMQDIPGLIRLLGGPDAFTQLLDRNFSEGHYRHDNEPGHHYAYLYDYAGQPEKTQQLIPEILAKHYKNRPDGLSGNDDCGQMSAWYVFSAMGFYPVCPGTTSYALGRPLFSRITLHLSKGRKFTIRANDIGQPGHTEVLLDGKSLTEPFLDHHELMKGKCLEFK